MNDESKDRQLLDIGDAGPSGAHDAAVHQSIEQAAQRIAKRRKRNRRSLRWFGLPAALTAGVLLATIFLPQQPDSYRDENRGGAIHPGNAAELASPPRSLSWPLQQDANGYSVELHRIDGTPIFSAQTQQPVVTVEIPADAMRAMTAGETYYWTVTVHQAVLRELGPYWYSLAPDAR